MTDREPSIEDADNPANVRYLLDHFSATIEGKDPPPGGLHPDGLTHRDARLLSNLVLRSVRKATRDPAASAVIEAEILIQLKNMGVEPE